jgi:N-methylhydantoinase B
MSVDPLTLAVLSNGLIATAEEMGWVLRKTSFSEAVREGEDCSASVFDAEGNMIAQGNYAPSHLGTSPTAIQGVLQRYPRASMRQGDAFLVNDPSMNSGHLPDIFSIAPVFHGSEVVGFTVVTAHHVDVGGAAPGSQAIVGIVDIHQEGIRILPCRHFVEGEPDEEVLGLIGANVRIPDQVIGDIKGQYNANMVGAAKLNELIERFGLETYRACGCEILDRSYAAMRSAISELPDGEYRFTEYLDDSGPGTDPIRIELCVRVTGDEIIADYTGSSPATRSGVNCYFPFARAYTYHALKCVIAPRLPQNSGCMRAVDVAAPVGSFCNAQYPTPSGGRAIIARHLVDAVLAAMAKCVPERSQAASSQLCNSTIGGVDPRTGKPFVYYDLTFGSTGARPHKDASDGLVAGFNTGNIPIEVHEAIWPVRVDHFGFMADSGGPGTFRGGLAVRRDVRNLADISRVTNLHDRHERAPWGLFGGRPGSRGRIILNPGSPDETELHSKSIVEVEHADLISFQTCGGGGWGDPLRRDPQAVRKDVLEGWVTPEGARRDYGVVMSSESEPQVLEKETLALREELANARASHGDASGGESNE